MAQLRFRSGCEHLIFFVCPFSLPKPDEKDPEMGTKEPPWVTPGPVS